MLHFKTTHLRLTIGVLFHRKDKFPHLLEERDTQNTRQPYFIWEYCGETLSFSIGLYLTDSKPGIYGEVDISGYRFNKHQETVWGE